MNRILKIGFGYGILATLTMSFFMLLAVMMQVSPMPSPVPVALVKLVLGALPKQALIVIGMVAHFLYGATAGAVFAYVTRRSVSVWKGMGWGVLLWAIMQLVFLPILGWGVFGSAHTLRIAVATLVLHLIYGAVLGGGLKWHRTHVVSSHVAENVVRDADHP